MNLKFNSATENAKLSIVLGKDGDNKYSLTLTETGITYIDYFGNETLYECDNFIGKLVSNEDVYIRVTLLGGILTFAAISENQSKELLNVNDKTGTLSRSSLVKLSKISLNVTSAFISLFSLQ